MKVAISSDNVLQITCDKLSLKSYIIKNDESLDADTIEHFLRILQSILLDQDGDEEKVEEVVRKTLLDIAYLNCELPMLANMREATSVISLIKVGEKWIGSNISDDEGQDVE